MTLPPTIGSTWMTDGRCDIEMYDDEACFTFSADKPNETRCIVTVLETQGSKARVLLSTTSQVGWLPVDWFSPYMGLTRLDNV